MRDNESGEAIASPYQPHSDAGAVEREQMVEAVEWRQRLSQQFKALDTVIANFQRKRIKPVFADVKKGVEGLTSYQFDEVALAKLLLLSKGAHRAEWMQVPNRTDLAPLGEPRRLDQATMMTTAMVITINDAWMQLDHAEQPIRVSFGARLDVFINIIAKATIEPVVVNIFDVLPARSLSERKRFADQQILRVALAAEDTKRQRKAEIDNVLGSAGSASLTKNETYNYDASSTGTSASMNKLEALKSLLMARRKAELDYEERKEALRAAGIEQERLQRLPLFCDVLRVLYHRQRRTSLSYHHVLATLSKETRHSREEIKKLIDLLCEAAPEFIFIVPPDEIVSEPYLKLNEYCDYKTCIGNIRTRIHELLSNNKLTPSVGLLINDAKGK